MYLYWFCKNRGFEEYDLYLRRVGNKEVKIAKKSMDSKHYLHLPESKAGLISLAHGVNDMYAGFLSTFIPFIKENLGLSYTLAGSFNVIVGIFHVVCQPIVGYLCDRMRRPILMMVGPILCGLGAVMLPNTHSYVMAIFFAGIWGFGSALYHPQGSGGIGYVSRPESLTRALTWFNIAGTFGSMLSPLIAVGTVKLMGYRGLPVTLVPALLLAPLLYFSMPILREEDVQGDTEKRKGFFETIETLFGVLYPIWALSLIRDLVFQCVRFFLPLRIVAQGGSLESVGTVIFAITLSGTLAMIPMGALSKKLGAKKILKASMLIGSAILLTAAFTKGMTSIVFYLLGIACVYSTLPLTVSMAQQLVPNDRSAASSIVMGLAWGFSNILLSPFGKIADLMGLEATVILIGLLPLIGIPFFGTSPFKLLKD